MGLTITALYAGLLGILLIILSVWVINMRRVHKVGLGDGGNPELQRAIRVHANFIEYVPLALILIAALESTRASAYGLHALGIVLVIARLAHAQGLGSSDKGSAGRAIGSGGTFIVILAASIWCLSRFLMT